MGSSKVMICLLSPLFITPIKEAKVEDLPLPVGPVTRTSPLCFLVNSTTDSGTPNSSGVGIIDPTTLMAAA